jgi:putative addiction module component (TIGR02574 family)
LDIAATLAEIKSLSIDERIALAEAIWDSISAESENLPLTEAQRVELERRLADDEANPDDVISWDVVRAEALARARR